MTCKETAISQTINRLLSDRVLAIGSGIGGPARQVARRTGNHLTGIDITPAYVDAARDLTVMAGLRDSVDPGLPTAAIAGPSTQILR